MKLKPLILKKIKKNQKEKEFKMNDKKELITYPWSEKNIDAFENLLNTAIHYSEKQGNIYLSPYNLVYIMLYSAFLKGLNYSEDYGNFDGACSVSLIAGGGLLLDNEDGITVTTEAQKNELVLALTGIENCQVGVFQFEWEDKEAFRISYACELYLSDNPIDLKLVKLSQKAEEIAHVLKKFCAKYSNRYDK